MDKKSTYLHHIVAFKLPSLLLLLFLTLFFSEKARGQDGIFSQLYAAPLYFNPAFAALDNKIELGVNYRNQIFNTNHNYFATQASFIYPIIFQKQKGELMDVNHRGAVGISIFNQSAGINHNLQTNGGLLTLAYNLHLNKTKTARISVAAQGGYVLRNIGADQLKWGSQYETLRGFNPAISPGVTLENTNKGYPVINAGAVFIRRKYKSPSDSTSVNRFMYAGVSASYLNSPVTSFTNSEQATEKLLLRGQAGIDFPLGERMLLSPHLMFQTQDGLSQLFGGLYYYFLLKQGSDNRNLITLVAGAWYRQSDALVGMLGVQFKEYTLGASYDYRLGGINEGNVNTDVLEISLKLRFGIKMKKASKIPVIKRAVDRYKPMLIL